MHLLLILLVQCRKQKAWALFQTLSLCSSVIFSIAHNLSLNKERPFPKTGEAPGVLTQHWKIVQHKVWPFHLAWWNSGLHFAGFQPYTSSFKLRFLDFYYCFCACIYESSNISEVENTQSSQPVQVSCWIKQTIYCLFPADPSLLDHFPNGLVETKHWFSIWSKSQSSLFIIPS